MALVFALRLTVLSLAMLAVSLGLFTWPFSASREWETLLVLFSGFSLSVAGVLLFIRFSHHLNRILLLAPLVALAPLQPKVVSGLFLLSSVIFLESFRRESGGMRWFRGAQALTIIGGAIVVFVKALWLWVAGFLVLILGAPAVFAAGCWVWQNCIKEELLSFDRD